MREPVRSVLRYLGVGPPFEDADFDGLFCHPPNAAFDFYADNYRRVLALNGGDATIGRKLYGYFGTAGLPRPELRLVQAAYASGEGQDTGPFDP